MRPTLPISHPLQAPNLARLFVFVLLFAGICTLSLCAPEAVYGNQEYMTVTFDDKALDQTIGTGGPANGEPSWIDEGLGATVRSTPFGTPCLEFRNLTGSGDMGFDLDTPITEGIIALVSDLWFYEESDWAYSLKLRNSYNQQIATIWFQAAGVAKITAMDLEVGDVPYATGRPIPILVVIDLDARTWSVWIDEVQWVDGQPLFEQIEDFQRVIVTAGSGTSEGNRCSIDQIRILDFIPEVPVKTTSWGRLRALYR